MIKNLCLLLFTFFLVPAAAGAQDRFKIVTIQHQTFAPYTLSLKGFMDGIKRSELGNAVIIENFNAKGDLDGLDRFIEQAAGRTDIDLIFTVGTRSTKKTVSRVKDIPIIFTDLGAPETSGVVKDWKGSNANYTGVETQNYVSIGINLLHELMDFKSIGMIYLKGSPSHEGTVAAVRKMSHREGFDFFAQGFALRDENNNRYPKDVIRKNIQDALNSVASRVDVFYVQISNTFEKNFDLFFDCFKTCSLPSAGAPIYIKKGLVIGIGRHKETFGAQCADYAVKILKGADPGTLPMDTGREFSFALNIEAATIVGYNPSIDILGAADNIYRNIDAKEQ